MVTRIRIVEPYPAQAIIDQCNRVIGARGVMTSTCPDSLYGDGGVKLINDPYYDGPVWVAVMYFPEKAIPGHGDTPDSSLEVNLYAAANYRGVNGSSHYDLHAWLIREMGAWLTEQRLTWLWEIWGEETGYVDNWFPSSVSPAFGDPERGRIDLGLVRA